MKDTVKRRPGCTCHWEPGDSSCPVHDFRCEQCLGDGETYAMSYTEQSVCVVTSACPACRGTGKREGLRP